jgi:hypothetical protein
MYYDEKEVQAHLVCLVCLETFEDPRILPCGISVCNDCIIVCSNKDEQTYYCKSCKLVHQVPDQGFIRNLNLASLISLKPLQISRGPAINQFKLALDKMYDEFKVFERILNEGNIYFELKIEG